MADKNNKVEGNVSGSIFVDETCIDCDLCREIAPDNFERSDDEGYSYVFKQPENEKEFGLCMDALEGCPVDAIGNDGDE